MKILHILLVTGISIFPYQLRLLAAEPSATFYEFENGHGQSKTIVDNDKGLIVEHFDGYAEADTLWTNAKSYSFQGADFMIECSGHSLRGVCSTIEANDSEYHSFTPFMQSFLLRNKSYIWDTFKYESTFPAHFPSDRLSGSEVVQGLTQSDTHWYLTTSDRIFKHPLSESLDNMSTSNTQHILDGICDHYGDPSFYRGRLYVPLEKCGDGVDRIKVYDENLIFLQSLNLDPNIQASNSWVGIDPISGNLLSSNFYNVDKINVYSLDWELGDTSTLEPIYTIELDHKINRVQGGAIDMNGTLYLSSDDQSNNKLSAGINVFQVNGMRAEKINFIHPNGFNEDQEEIEGLTIFDTRNHEIPGKNGVSMKGQLHWALVSSPRNQLTTHRLWLKHVTLEDFKNYNYNSVIMGAIL